MKIEKNFPFRECRGCKECRPEFENTYNFDEEKIETRIICKNEQICRYLRTFIKNNKKDHPRKRTVEIPEEFPVFKTEDS